MKGQQISMFQMLDEYETQQIPPDKQKKGMKGWIIEISGIFLKENGYKDDWTGVETRPIIFDEDTRKDRDGFTCQQAHTIKGPHQGWLARPQMIFIERPSWADCLKYGRDVAHKKGYPEEIRFYSLDGDWNGIYSYEKGY